MGIDGKTNKWIMGFLTNRSQKVVVDGISSKDVSVDSGVPQGSVLVPLLFLCHINDFLTRVTSQVRSEDDHSQIQQDLRSLE